MSDAQTSSSYELLYIIPTTMTDEEVGTVEGKVGGLIEKYGGKVESTTRLGKLRLAFLINNQRHGHYVLVRFAAAHPQVAKIEESLRITPEVLRHLIVRADETSSKYEMVSFQEVNLDNKEDRPRRSDADARRKRSDVKEEKTEVKAGTTVAAGALTSEDVDKKIETALSEDQKEA